MPDINPLPVSQRTRRLLQAVRDEGTSVGAERADGADDASDVESSAEAQETDEAEGVEETDGAEEVEVTDEADEMEEVEEVEETDEAPESGEAERGDGSKTDAAAGAEDADEAVEAADTDAAARPEAVEEAADAEESYDELLQRLVVDHHRYVLSERFHGVAGADADALQPIDEFELLDPSGEFDVLVPPSVTARVEDLGDRAEQPIKRTWESVAEEPFPEPSRDLKSALPFGAENWYRHRMEQSWWIFYLVDEADAEVRIVAVERAEEARERYALEPLRSA